MYVNDVVYVLCFIQVTKPIISSRIIRFQIEQTNNIVVLTVFIFILNISVEQTKFQSLSQLTFMTVDNVKSFTQTLTYTFSDIHGIRKSICTPGFTPLRRYIWHFLSKLEYCNVVSEGILNFLPLFTISTLPINDVIHEVPGYFKCC